MLVASKCGYIFHSNVIYQTLWSLGNIMHEKEIHSMISQEPAAKRHTGEPMKPMVTKSVACESVIILDHLLHSKDH